eukprot:m.1152645 g.1152645  ORF g.1152645 m.1152645 type:complete len:315 (-) comp24484_c1_seq14:160-1104(-)
MPRSLQRAFPAIQITFVLVVVELNAMSSFTFSFMNTPYRGTSGHSGQELLDRATLQINYGQKYGLVGRNGVGKSSLLRAIASGLIQVPKFIHVVHVEQECTGDERTALETILDADIERNWLLEMEKKLNAESADEEKLGIDLIEVYERLEEMSSDKAESRAACILQGLGFDQEMMETKTKDFSGGWRMRISLAQALFVMPDLLLLDEPTNHLDVFACTWLEQFLNAWEKTVVIVSHDRGFLNRVTRNTVFLFKKRLWYYGGSYDTFLKVRAERSKHSSTMAKSKYVWCMHGVVWRWGLFSHIHGVAPSIRTRGI